MAIVHQKILDILACPLCKGKLVYHPDKQELVCRFHKLAYSIKDGMPIMSPETARRLTDNDII